MRHLWVLLWVLWLIWVISITGPALASFSAPQQPLRFDVSLDDRAIGYHSFDFSSDDSGQLTVDVDAAFDVRVLLIPVFSYQHSNRETWRDGCLERIESETDSNGTRFQVSGVSRDGVFELNGDGASKRLETNCLMTFAYWDQRLLEQRQLLNAQTGEVVDVVIGSEGEERVMFDNRQVDADVYRISGDDGEVDIRLWYEQDSGKWLRLESRLPNTRLLRYERRPVLAGGDHEQMVSR